MVKITSDVADQAIKRITEAQSCISGCCDEGPDSFDAGTVTDIISSALNGISVDVEFLNSAMGGFSSHLRTVVSGFDATDHAAEESVEGVSRGDR